MWEKQAGSEVLEMNVYVIGAGVSMGAGYPLGWELFDKVDH
jgi:hypothetical protein